MKTLTLIGLLAITASANLIPGAANANKFMVNTNEVKETDKSEKMLYPERVDISKLSEDDFSESCY